MFYCPNDLLTMITKGYGLHHYGYFKMYSLVIYPT